MGESGNACITAEVAPAQIRSDSPAGPNTLEIPTTAPLWPDEMRPSLFEPCRGLERMPRHLDEPSANPSWMRLHSQWTGAYPLEIPVFFEIDPSEPSSKILLRPLPFEHALQSREIFLIRAAHRRRHERRGDPRKARWLASISQGHP